MKMIFSPGRVRYSLYGDTEKILETAGLALWESVYQPYLNIPKHTHTEGGYFDFVLKGGYTELSKKGRRDFSRSEVIFQPPGESHADQFHDQETRLFSVSFTAEWLNRIKEQAAISDVTVHFNGGLPTQLAVRLYREYRETDAVSSLMIEGLALEMLALVSRESRKNLKLSAAPPPRWLLRAQELLHARFRENLTLSMIAESAGVHRVHLNKVFRQHFRCAIGEYIRRLRIEFACQKLSSSQDKLAEIAHAAGFADQSHFCRVFHKFTDMTPLQYRAAFNSPCSRSKTLL
jgi:AraC family transcriptional regulator